VTVQVPITVWVVPAVKVMALAAPMPVTDKLLKVVLPEIVEAAEVVKATVPLLWLKVPELEKPDPKFIVVAELA